MAKAQLSIFAEEEANMANKKRNLNFEELKTQLIAQGFEVTSSDLEAGAVLVSKGGAAAVLVPAPSGAVTFAVTPGVLINGQVARLLDRGYQKFLRTQGFEIPATAAQLHAIHHFREDLTLFTGGTNLYNEALGTTSDLYQYDRLKGREAIKPRGARPWELTGRH